MADNAGPRQIPASELGLEQLTMLQKQCDSEISMFTESGNELKRYEQKYKQAEEALSALNADDKDKPALVPLSQSMFVRGKIVDANKVLVSIGTGFFVEMTLAQASDYQARKQKYLQEQQAKIETVVTEKRRARDALMAAIQGRVQQQLANQSRAS